MRQEIGGSKKSPPFSPCSHGRRPQSPATAARARRARCKSEGARARRAAAGAPLQCLEIKPFRRVVIADFADDVADELLIVDDRLRGDLAAKHDHIAFSDRF